VCDKTCIFCFFPIINKYLCMAKRSLLSERPLHITGGHSGAVGWGTALQSGTSTVQSRWGHLDFSLPKFLWPHYSPGTKSASNRNEYQEYLLGAKGSHCIWLTTLPPSCADCLEIWEPQTPGASRTCPCL